MRRKDWIAVALLLIPALIIFIYKMNSDKLQPATQHITNTRAHGLKSDPEDKWLYVFQKIAFDDPSTPNIDESDWILLNPNLAHPEITKPNHQ